MNIDIIIENIVISIYFIQKYKFIKYNKYVYIPVKKNQPYNIYIIDVLTLRYNLKIQHTYDHDKISKTIFDFLLITTVIINIF